LVPLSSLYDACLFGGCVDIRKAVDGGDPDQGAGLLDGLIRAAFSLPSTARNG
jgi:hypothetical protein